MKTITTRVLYPTLLCLAFFYLPFLQTNLLAQTSCDCDATTNLIPEGDFEITGNSLPAAYSTDLNPLCACNYGNGNAGFGSYCIETDADLKCASFDNIYDHTSGAGKFMVVDGFPDSDPSTPTDPNIVWKYGLNITTPGDYEFSFWYHPNLSNYVDVLPEFGFRVDYNAVVSGIGGASATLDQWNEFCATVTINTPGFHVFEIAQTNTGDISNDYGIDDVFLGHCCSCGVNADFTALQTGPNTVNFTSTSTFNSCTTPFWYYWTYGDGTQDDGPTLANPVHVYPGPGNYIVQLTVFGIDATGMECVGKFELEVKVEDWEEPCNLTPCLTGLASTNLITLNNCSTDPILIDHWTYQIYPPPYDPNVYNSYSGSVSSGQDASLSPSWNLNYLPIAGPGTYTICLWVYDLDVPPPFEGCYEFVCIKVVVPKDPVPDCDVIAGFNTVNLGGTSYAFQNTSTASSALTHYWTITNLTTNQQVNYVPNGPANHTYTLPGNGTYQVCLEEYQVDAGGECWDTYCDTIVVTDAANFLDFYLNYNCEDPEPSLIISSIVTNGSPVSITTSCSSPATVTPDGNASPVTVPLTQNPYVIANQPPLSYSTCQVCVTDANNLNVCKTIYFNCQACPGAPKSPVQGAWDGFEIATQPRSDMELVVQPNPVSDDEVQVRINGLTGPTALQLTDASGRVIHTYNLDVGMRTVQLPVSLQGLPAGMYLIRVVNDAGMQVAKIIRQ
jgi:hypothetical protein